MKKMVGIRQDQLVDHQSYVYYDEVGRADCVWSEAGPAITYGSGVCVPSLSSTMSSLCCGRVIASSFSRNMVAMVKSNDYRRYNCDVDVESLIV